MSEENSPLAGLTGDDPLSANASKTPLDTPGVTTIEADVDAPPQQIVRRGGTFESFKHRDFVWFWSGALVSNVGTWMQNYALGIVVFALRRSEFDLGFINFISGIPVLFLAVAGGAIADRFDRRRLLIGIQVVLLVQATALGVLYNSGALSAKHATFSLVWIGLLGVVAGVFSAIQFPAWQAMLPDLVPRPALLNAIALNAAQFQSSRLVGPLIAGALVVAGAGMGEIFYVNAASFLFVILALAVVQIRYAAPAEATRRQREPVREALLGGLRYATRENRVVGVLLLSTAVMTVFGFPFMTLLPAFIDKVLGFAAGTAGYNRTVALVMSANGLGAMVGALTIASLPATVKKERIVPFALLSLGIALFALSLSRHLWLTVLISPFAGAALITSNSMVNSAIQASAPPHLRGRVMGLFVTAFMGMMPISGLIFGSLGQWIGPAGAVLAGSVGLFAWSLLLIARRDWLTPTEEVSHGAQSR